MTNYYIRLKISIGFTRKEVRKMRKLLLACLFVAGLFFVFPKSAAAANGDGSLRHAYRPHVVTETRAMRARIDNFATMPQNKLVCVEAMKTKTHHRTHLGCLRVNLDSFGSTMAEWAVEFDAPTYMLPRGTYTVMYFYQGMDGAWHKVLSTTLKNQDGMFTAP